MNPTELPLRCWHCGHEWMTLRREAGHWYRCPHCKARNSEPDGEAWYYKAQQEKEARG